MNATVPDQIDRTCCPGSIGIPEIARGLICRYQQVQWQVAPGVSPVRNKLQRGSKKPADLWQASQGSKMIGPGLDIGNIQGRWPLVGEIGARRPELEIVPVKSASAPLHALFEDRCGGEYR